MFSLRLYNVGQAFTALLDFGADRYAIVDLATEQVEATNPCLEELVDKIEAGRDVQILFLFITHLHWDHISSLPLLFEPRYELLRRRIRRFFCNGSVISLMQQAIRKAPNALDAYLQVGRKSVAFRMLDALASAKCIADETGSPSISEYDVGPENAAEEKDLTPGELAVDGFRILLCGPTLERREAVARLPQGQTPEGLTRCILTRTGKERPDWNTSSGVLVIEYAGRRVFLPGDATGQTFRDLSRLGVFKACLKADVVVCWHHGGRLGKAGTGSGDVDWDSEVWGFLAAAGSESLLLISCGTGNVHKHPSKATIREAMARGARVMCTGLGRCRKEDDVPAEVRSRARRLHPDGRGHYWRSAPCYGDLRVDIAKSGVIAAPEPPWVVGSTSCCLEVSRP